MSGARSACSTAPPGWSVAERLEQLGGPPPADPAPRLDPILFGADPTARGDAWKERGLWDRAEAAYAEAVRARPLNRPVWDALARLHVERGHLDRAAATLAEAVRLMPDDLELRRQLRPGPAGGPAIGPAGGGRTPRCSIASAGRSTAWTANSVAWACVLGPEATADPEVPVRLAEAAVQGAAETDKAELLEHARGRAVPRRPVRRGDPPAGGRHPAPGRGESCPQDWAFLAMAHHRLGHRDEARRWLDRLRTHQPSADPTQFWNELEIRLLRSEAEAVILYDPAFPADPFAR